MVQFIANLSQDALENDLCGIHFLLGWRTFVLDIGITTVDDLTEVS